MNRRHDICVVGLKCYDHVTNAPEPRYIGGIERQLTTLAKQLVIYGKTVAFITYKHPDSTNNIIDGIEVRTTFDPRSGIRGLRFFYPRAFRLIQAVVQARPKVVLQMGAGIETLLSWIAAKVAGARFIYFVASDADCDRELPFIQSNVEKAAYRIGLRGANSVVAQTEVQKRALKKEFQLFPQKHYLPYVQSQAEIIDNDLPGSPGPAVQMNRVIWVGRISEEKRPEWLIQAARRLPKIEFRVIGAANADSDFSRQFIEAAESLRNLHILGKVSDAELINEFRSAEILACTSEYEGFPTTFLEAWSNGIPVITSFDPDGLVLNHNLGMVVDSLEHFVEALMTFFSEYDMSDEIFACKRFFDDHFQPEKCLPDLIKLIDGEYPDPKCTV